MGSTYCKAFRQRDGALTKPFLRWAGGKQWLVAELSACLKPLLAEGRYFEPFLGGGSLFFAARPSNAYLSDSNARLIETYDVVRDRAHELGVVLRSWPRTKDAYYHIRGATFSDKTDRAAQFIYLNRLCWNGLYRVNREGAFNVPYGGEAKDKIIDMLDLPAAAVALGRARLIACDFELALSTVSSKDIVYLDPPYTVLHASNGFRRYNETIFSWEDQERLAGVASDLARRGAHVVVSNADHDSLRQLYHEFIHYRRLRPSLIAGSATRRMQTSELIFSSFLFNERSAFWSRI